MIIRINNNDNDNDNNNNCNNVDCKLPGIVRGTYDYTGDTTGIINILPLVSY